MNEVVTGVGGGRGMLDVFFYVHLLVVMVIGHLSLLIGYLQMHLYIYHVLFDSMGPVAGCLALVLPCLLVLDAGLNFLVNDGDWDSPCCRSAIFK